MPRIADAAKLEGEDQAPMRPAIASNVGFVRVIQAKEASALRGIGLLMVLAVSGSLLRAEKVNGHEGVTLVFREKTVHPHFW